MTPTPDAVLKGQHHAVVRPLIEAIEQQRGSRVLAYFLDPGAAIADDVVEHFYEHLLRIGHQAQIDLWIESRGGSTEVPWRLVSLIREFADRFCVLVPYHAASAATHVAMGADEIVMTEIAQLGPVDPSRQHPLLPFEEAPDGTKKQLMISVQDLRHFIQFVEKEGGPEAAPADTTDIYVELMRQVHPLVIGAMEQSYALAKLISRNMLSLHMDPVADEDKISAIADRLADDYKSHVYPINRREARELGLPVVDADPTLRDALWTLWRHYNAAPLQIPLPTKGPPGVPVPVAASSGAFVDSADGTVAGARLIDASNAVLGFGWFSWWV